MRTKISGLIIATLLLAACAQKGVVVEKRLKPSPFAYSNGMDAIYSFMLRDEQGHVRSQMVTPDVFMRYDVGDYFDDQQAGPVRREGFSKESSANSDSKSVKPVRHSARRKQAQRTHRSSVAARHKKQHHTLRVAVKSREEEVSAAASSGLEVHP